MCVNVYVYVCAYVFLCVFVCAYVVFLPVSAGDKTTKMC
jgi:hypothetical protein